MVSRIAAAVLLIGIALILLIAGWPQLFGLQYAPLVAQVVSLRAVAAIGAAVLALLLLVMAIGTRRHRSFWMSVVAMLLVFTIASGSVLLDRGVGGTVIGGGPAGTGSAGTGAVDGEAAAPDGAIGVLAWNTLGDEPGAQAIAEVALETGADIVSLPETSLDTATEVAVIMREAGRPMWVNHVAFDELLTARSTALLTSTELGTYSVDASRGNTETVPSVIAVPDSGVGPTIIAAHPVAPIPGYLDEWQRGLEWLSTVCVGDDVIMAGDLNSTLDHYSGLGNGRGGTIGDCVDAAVELDAGAVGTWPTNFPALIGAPIDHVMATPNWRPIAARVILDRDDAGSDHRPIFASFVPAG